MTEPLTVDDVVALLERAARVVCDTGVDCPIRLLDDHCLLVPVIGPVLLLNNRYAGTAVETGDLRQVLETAKEIGVLPSPDPKPRRWDDEPIPPADVIIAWCKDLRDTDIGSIEAQDVVSVGVLRDIEGGWPTWAILLQREVSSAVTFRVCDIMSAPDELALVIAGYVKWDGCLNIASVSDHGGDHFCGPGDEPNGVARIARLLSAVYALAHPLFERPDFEKPYVADLTVVRAPPARAVAT